MGKQKEKRKEAADQGADNEPKNYVKLKNIGKIEKKWPELKTVADVLWTKSTLYLLLQDVA